MISSSGAMISIKLRSPFSMEQQFLQILFHYNFSVVTNFMSDFYYSFLRILFQLFFLLSMSLPCITIFFDITNSIFSCQTWKLLFQPFFLLSMSLVTQHYHFFDIINSIFSCQSWKLLFNGFSCYSRNLYFHVEVYILCYSRNIFIQLLMLKSYHKVVTLTVKAQNFMHTFDFVRYLNIVLMFLLLICYILPL